MLQAVCLLLFAVVGLFVVGTCVAIYVKDLIAVIATAARGFSGWRAVSSIASWHNVQSDNRVSCLGCTVY